MTKSRVKVYVYATLVVLLIMGILWTGAWYTDTIMASGSGQFSTVTLGSSAVTYDVGTDEVLMPTMVVIPTTNRTYTYTGAQAAYYRVSYSIAFQSYNGSSWVTTTVSDYTIPSTIYGNVTTNGVITLSDDMCVISSSLGDDLNDSSDNNVTNVEGMKATIVITIDVVQQDGMLTTAALTFAYLDGEGYDYSTGNK